LQWVFALVATKALQLKESIKTAFSWLRPPNTPVPQPLNSSSLIAYGTDEDPLLSTEETKEENDITIMELEKEIDEDENDWHLINVADMMDSTKRIPLHFQLITTALFLLYTVHFRLSVLVLKKFEPCQDGYMAQYLWIPCDFRYQIFSHCYFLSNVIHRDSNFAILIALAIFFLFFFTLGIPLLFCFLLYYARNDIRSHHDERVRDWMGFLYKSFRAHLFYFEVIWLLRRILLVIALTIIPEQSAFSSIAVSMLLLGFLILHCWLKPCRSYVENLLEGISLFALLITVICHLIVQSCTVETTDKLVSMVFVMNGCVVCLFVGLLIWPVMFVVLGWIRDICGGKKKQV
jgi:hypothetical protein